MKDEEEASLDEGKESRLRFDRERERERGELCSEFIYKSFSLSLNVCVCLVRVKKKSRVFGAM